jgi:hypothetical protein
VGGEEVPPPLPRRGGRAAQYARRGALLILQSVIRVDVRDLTARFLGSAAAGAAQDAQLLD